MKLLIPLATIASLALQANSATVPVYGTCGGIGWTGGTECDPGLICYYWNIYAQCLYPVSTVVTSSVGYTTCAYTTTYTTYITIKPTTTATRSTSTATTTKSTITIVKD
ncbi:hypothetical protein M407DRAFT_125699 [Tulasnella calospora MUT 4182]|uniref:CBM1 domain-containing protein n=1 Tax=Tulasnella calospora MUT 4182 TaxID=1051891 RepID=A0A0C3LJC2_9AGAM|nr:hypothetical protein M407DRAFT_125699 [Tulasnella calospora MUT 4182]